MIGAASVLDEVAFGLSAGLALLATNLDNLVLLLALAPGLGAKRAGTAFLTSQAIVLGAALSVGAALAALAGGWVWTLGLVPIAIGLRSLVAGGHTLSPAARTSGTGGAILAFLALGTDSFAVFTPILADSLPRYQVAALAGAMLATTIAVSAVLVLHRRSTRLAQLSARAEAAVPYIMIAAGIYVLLNSGTDTVQ